MNKPKCSEDKCSNMKFRYLYIHTHKYQQTYIKTTVNYNIICDIKSKYYSVAYEGAKKCVCVGPGGGGGHTDT